MAFLSSPSEPAVALVGITIGFALGNGSTYTAVSSIDLEARPAEFVAIVGPTGCGKSTLLNVAAGLLAPRAGSVTVFGVPLTALNRRPATCSSRMR